MVEPKVMTCKECGRKFTQEAGYELDDYGDLIKSSIHYHDICPVCENKINPTILQTVLNYQEGLITKKELMDELDKIK